MREIQITNRFGIWVFRYAPGEETQLLWELRNNKYLDQSDLVEVASFMNALNLGPM